MTLKPGEVLEITGKYARVGATIFISIIGPEEVVLDNLIVFSKSDGDFYTIWNIPNELQSGTYQVIAKDAINTDSTSFIIN